MCGFVTFLSFHLGISTADVWFSLGANKTWLSSGKHLGRSVELGLRLLEPSAHIGWELQVHDLTGAPSLELVPFIHFTLAP